MLTTRLALYSLTIGIPLWYHKKINFAIRKKLKEFVHKTTKNWRRASKVYNIIRSKSVGLGSLCGWHFSLLFLSWFIHTASIARAVTSFLTPDFLWLASLWICWLRKVEQLCQLLVSLTFELHIKYFWNFAMNNMQIWINRGYCYSNCEKVKEQ